jgi:hypothetical protein
VSLFTRLVALLALVLLANACTESSARDQARQRWDSRIDGDFVLSFETVCACSADGLRFDVKFHRAEPISASFTSGGRERKLTPLALELVPTAEELIALAGQEDEFDGKTGLPVEVRRGDVTYRNIGVTFDIEAGQAAVEAARLAWDDRGLENYRLKYRCPRGCGDRGWIRVEWRDGELFGDTNAEAPTSVEELLDLVDEALASSPDSVAIRVRKGGLLKGAKIVDADHGTLLDVRGITIEPTAVP